MRHVSISTEKQSAEFVIKINRIKDSDSTVMLATYVKLFLLLTMRSRLRYE